MEPGFYSCKKCNRNWQRMEYKMATNAPKVCPHCGAGAEDQGIDQTREDAYVKRVYAPLAEAIAKGLEKK